MMAMWRMLAIAAVAVLFVGCSDRVDEAKAWVQDVKNRPAPPIEPLPQVRPYQVFEYAASNLRVPFEKPAVLTEQARRDTKKSASQGLQPDRNRPKEPLEAFALDALSMVGTMFQDQKVWAIVLDSSGVIHRVTVGDHMGQNFGKITSISDRSILLNEIVPGDHDTWQQRETVMQFEDGP